MLNENRNEIKTLTANAVELSEKTNKLLTDNADNINILFSDLKSLVKKSDELLTDLNTLTSETINQQNNIGKLLYDKEIFKKLNTTLERIDELTSILIDQLKNEGINVDANIF